MHFPKYLAALLALAAHPALAQTAISSLPPASTLSGSEIVPMVQSGVTKQATTAAITTVLTAQASTWTARQAFTLTYPGLNTSQTGVNVNTGGCISTDYPGGASGNYSTTAIAGCIVTPAGTYTGTTATWPDAAVTAIAINANAGANKTSVPLFAFGGTSVSGAYVYGGNINSLNCRNYSASCTYGAGFDTAIQYTLEVDTNRYSKAGGVTPSGFVNGLLSQLFGDTQSTTAISAFTAVGSPYGGAGAVKWDNAYNTTAAGATYAAFFNSVCISSGTCNSQDIRLVSRNSGTPVYSDIYGDSNGYLNLTGPAGVIVNTPLEVLANAAGTLPPSCGTGQTITSNYSNSIFEVDVLNCANAGNGFTWYQKTGASTATQLMRVDSSGNLTIPSTLTAVTGTFSGSISAPSASFTGNISTSGGTVSAIRLLLIGVTFAALPTCNAGAAGLIYYVTDASAAPASWHAAVTAGGGSNKTFVQCLGSSWLAF